MERAVIVERLVRNFEVTERREGFVGSVFSMISPRRKNVEALKGISFSIERGDLVGFIGPNGAGKTTTLKILAGILYPTQGYVQVAGYTPWERKEPFLKKIAFVMGQKNQLWWDLPASATYELIKAIYGLSRRQYQKSLGELTSILQVEDLLNIPVRRLSLGQRMRLELIAALLHQPRVIFLDEPTIGLDVVAQDRMRDFIASYNRRFEATIILTSHNMDDVSNLAKRVIVINEGEIVFDGNLSELIARFAKKKIIKIYADREIDYGKLEKIGKVLKIKLPEVTLSIPRGVAKVAAAELIQSFPIDDLTIEEEPIESVIKEVFSETVKSKNHTSRKVHRGRRKHE